MKGLKLIFISLAGSLFGVLVVMTSYNMSVQAQTEAKDYINSLNLTDECDILKAKWDYSKEHSIWKDEPLSLERRYNSCIMLKRIEERIEKDKQFIEQAKRWIELCDLTHNNSNNISNM